MPAGGRVLAGGHLPAGGHMPAGGHVIVELCGIPGSGKSTLARDLVAELDRRGCSADLPLEDVSPRAPKWHRLWRKGWRAGVELAIHPRTSAMAIREVIRSRQPTGRDKVARSLNWLVLRASLRRARHTPGIHVFDQGVIQELGSLGYRGEVGAATEIADPGDDLLAPDVVVVVDVDLVVAAERLARRPGQESRLEDAGLDRLGELERYEGLIEGLLGSWLENYGGHVPTTTQHVVSTPGPVELGPLVDALRNQHGPNEATKTLLGQG